MGLCGKKAIDLKKIKGYNREINLSNYTLQKGIMHLEGDNLSEAEIDLEEQLVNHLNLRCHINI